MSSSKALPAPPPLAWGPSTLPIAATTLLLLVAVAFWWAHGADRRRGLLPPGPRAWPLVGNLLRINHRAPYDDYVKLSREYGPVFTVYLGRSPFVILVGFKAVREALVHQAIDFSFRPYVPVFDCLEMYDGITMAHGNNFILKKRFSLSVLKSFGFGKQRFQDKIFTEAGFLVKHVADTKGQAFNVSDLLVSAVSNVICSVVFGERFEDGDPQLLKLVHCLDDVSRLVGSPWIQLYNSFPSVMKHLPGTHNLLFEKKRMLIEHIQMIIDNHKTAWVAEQPRDYIDAFMDKQQQESANPDSPFHAKSLVACTLSLFMAGTETLYVTLRWALLLMMHHPDTQRRVQEEIDTVVGRHRMPVYADHTSLPFTNAVVHEVQRYANMLPYSFPHATPSDVTFRGYLIPKGTQVIPVLGSVLKDPSMWETPDDFNPGHFLDAAGQFRQREAFMPFSAGRRLCLGESLAKTELFIFFSSLMHTFTFAPPPDCPAPAPASPATFIHAPPQYHVCALGRTPIA
ncbi:unnamed protein product [Lampetra fluviatilis]